MPQDPCDASGVLDFELVSQGVGVMRLLRISNPGATAAAVTSLALPSAEYSADPVLYAGLSRVLQPLPFTLVPGASLWAEVTLVSQGPAGPLPSPSVVTVAAVLDGAVPQTLTLGVKGTVLPQCGNGVLEPGEECDFGAANGGGTGCETSCLFSCHDHADCGTGSVCAGAPTCVEVLVGAARGKVCQRGEILGSCTSCGTNSICVGGACVAPTCGDGCRTAPEQCDDANTANLDGCNSTCGFEQVQRMNSIRKQYATNAFCTANAFGRASASLAQQQEQTALDQGVASGDISVLLAFTKLENPVGLAPDSDVGTALLNGTPVAGTGYDGTLDLDWWYTPDPADLTADHNLACVGSGSLFAGTLQSNQSCSSYLDLGAGRMRLSSVKLRATAGAASVPLASTGTPPGHLPAENLDPALTAFQSLGSGAAYGELCGNISAASLAAMPMPSALLGPVMCGEGYGAANSMLDVLVGGCTIFMVPAMTPTQPDTADPNAAAPGAGAPYKLSPASGSRSVTVCKDKNNAVVNLAACLEAAAYSSYFKFTADRVILR